MKTLVVAALLLLTPLVDAAVRTGGLWQSLQPPSTDKAPSTTGTTSTTSTTSSTTTPSYVEAALFRKPAATSTQTPEPEVEVLVDPGRFPPVWRPSLLGEDLVGSLLRHTATDEFDRSHGRYIDSFIHGQPLGFF